MKLSQTPTDTIFVKARTQSEWDIVDLGIIRLNAAYQNTISVRAEAASHFKEDPTFNDLSFWDNWIEWIKAEDEDEELQVIIDHLENNSYCFVIVEQYDDIAGLGKPLQQISAVQMQMNANGSINYLGYGKHTSEEFSTESIELSAILSVELV
jgi:hypothetical protein